MKHILPADLSLKNLTVEELAKYLLRNGWKAVSTNHEKVMFYRGPNDDHGRPLELVLPKSNRFRDATDLFSVAINLLSALEDRAPADIISAMHSFHSDILRQRVLGPTVFSGALSLGLAVKVVQNLRDLISFAASQEEDPQPYFSRAREEGKRFAEQCRFGQTFAGSFGFTVEAPIPPAAEQTGPPFERRVMQRIVRGLVAIREGMMTDNVESMTESYREGFNANMYESILNLAPDAGRMELEYSVAWSPEWKVDPVLERVRSIHLDDKAFQYLGSVVKQLRHIGKKTKVRGKIIQLSAEFLHSPQVDERGKKYGGSVTILWEVERYNRIKIDCPLDAKDYAKACDAHKGGKFVSVTGTPEKRGRNWKLIAPVEFQIVGDSCRTRT